MQIKDVELQSGMTRANIRYYESEGLLRPQRGDNGYRIYSQEDIDILQRIKLLRTLQVSLEDIKAIHQGDLVLETVLQTHMERLTTQRVELAQAQTVCQQLQDDHVSYQTLNASYYLNLLENPTAENPLEGDTLPKEFAPWRRFFARGLDVAIYKFPIMLVASLVFKMNIGDAGTGWDILSTVLSVGVMFAIEPILLSRFGTTLGKWVLGLSVTHEDGGKLTWHQGFERLVGLCTYGEGWYIPLVGLWRNYASYCAYEKGEPLEWEEDSRLVAKAWDSRRVLGFLAIEGVIIGLTALAASTVGVPSGDGNMTVSEFAEHYNEMSAYYDVSTGFTMDAYGVLQKNPSHAGSVEMGMGSDDIPVFTFEEENGYLTSVGFTADMDGYPMLTSHVNTRILAMLAFASQQEGGSVFNGDVAEAIEQLQDNPLDNVDEFTFRGVTIRSEIQTQGCYHDNGSSILLGMPGAEESWCRMVFTMER